MANKSITLEFQDYVIKGVSDITPWGGGLACIPMDPFRVTKTDIKTLLANINDGGFGVQSINGAICDIFENYEGKLIFKETVTVGDVSEHTREFYRLEY